MSVSKVKTRAVAAVLALSTLFAASAKAGLISGVIVDFENHLETENTSALIGASVNEGGFTLSVDPSNTGVADNEFFTIGTPSQFFPGSAVASVNPPNGVYHIQKDGGGAFDFEAVDIGNAFGNETEVTFIGLTSGGLNVEKTFNASNSATFFLGDTFNDVVLVSASQAALSVNGHYIDNLNFQDAIPEPSTLALIGGVGMGAFALRRLRLG